MANNFNWDYIGDSIYNALSVSSKISINMDNSAVFRKTHNEFDPWKDINLKASRVKSTAYFDVSEETEIERKSGE